MTFVFRPGLFFVTALALAILVGLGTWQLKRKAWKDAVVERIEAAASAPQADDFGVAFNAWNEGSNEDFRKVRITGVFDHAREAHVFGTRDGVPGYYIFTPMELTSPRTPQGEALYVNRGFVPENAKEPASRPESLVKGEVEVVGAFRSPEAPTGLTRVFLPANQPEENIWHVRQPQSFAYRHGARALPVYVQSSGAENAARLPQPAPATPDLPNRHLEYALTWYGLAAGLLAIFFVMSVRRR